jgi:anthranilate phosphoribosyltransferase
MLDFFIEKIQSGKSLTQAESYQGTILLLSPETAAEKIIAYLSALHSKGELVEEVLGAISALQTQMVHFPVEGAALDIVGTGGDQAHSVNISTGAAILAASCGVPIVKHGNRAVSSSAGSADVLEALGIDIHLSPEKSIAIFDAIHLTFCFAPQFHPAFVRLRPIRKGMGTPTIFNMIGPFLNPARPAHYLMGVFSPALLESFADILCALAVKKSAVVHSDGMDELTCYAPTEVIEITQQQKKIYTIHPAQFGFQRCDKTALVGGDAAHNATLLTAALSGQQAGPIADTLILNAAMAIYLYGKTQILSEAVEIARESIASGKAIALLANWKSYCGT